MKKAQIFGCFLSAVGFLAVAGSGVDLVSSRTGGGLILLGLGGLLVFFTSLTSPIYRKNNGLVLLSCLGSGYFVWRAFSGGPIGLALPDIALVLIAIATYLAIDSCGRRGRAAFLIVLVVVCVANVSIAFYQKFGVGAFFFWDDKPSAKQAVTGIFGHYNPLAAFLNGSVFFFLSYFFLGKKIAFKAVSCILVIGIFTALVFCGSRGGWLSFIVGGIIWLAVTLTFMKQRKSKRFGLTIILGVVLVFVAIISAHSRIQQLTDGRQKRPDGNAANLQSVSIDDGGRLEFQQLAFEIFQDHPVIGAGPRAFSYLSLDYWDKERRSLRERPPEYVHNEYLQAIADYGLVGLIFLMVVIISHLILGSFRAVTSADEESDLAIWQIGAAAGMASILAQCFFSFLLHIPACVALLAFQVGVLASGRPEEARDQKSGVSRIVASFGNCYRLCVSVMLLFLGYILAQSYNLSRAANDQIVSITDESSAFAALEKIKSAGNFGLDPEAFEVMGRLAMSFARNSFEKNNLEQARRFNLVAKDAFESALFYHPRFPAGVAGLPRVEDALGNVEEAERGHQKAMKELWAREFQLRPHLYAAQSSRRSAYRELHSGDRKKALSHFRIAHERLITRKALLVGATWEVKEDKKLRFEIEGWISYLEAQLLFKEGDRVWKNARPRNPELAYGLMLEAQKRFQASEAEVKDKNPNWQRFVDQLEYNLTFLAGGRVVPSKLSDEQIVEIIGSEAGLDSQPATR